jgi:Cu-processing system permease protein
MNRIIKLIVSDIVKNKIILVYTVILAVLSWGTFSLEDNSTKGLLTILNVILLTVPLVSVIFTTIYIYNSSEFIELLVSQPLKRNKIWSSLFIGVSLSLLFAFLIGAGIPVMIYAQPAVGIMMVLAGAMVTLVFVSLAFLSSVMSRDKAKGIGISILIWLFFAIMFDGLILFLLFQLSDYPIEYMLVALVALNPIDLARILILLHLDVSAMMGYTGAIFKDFFGSAQGITITFAILVLWSALPFLISLRKFRKKDL